MKKKGWKHRIKIREYPELSVSQTPQGASEIEDNYYIREDEVLEELDKAREEGREEIIQLLKDKKLLGDWLKKHPRKEVVV